MKIYVGYIDDYDYHEVVAVSASLEVVINTKNADFVECWENEKREWKKGLIAQSVINSLEEAFLKPGCPSKDYLQGHISRLKDKDQFIIINDIV